jgi:hypothetical protein
MSSGLQYPKTARKKHGVERERGLPQRAAKYIMLQLQRNWDEQLNVLKPSDFTEV